MTLADANPSAALTARQRALVTLLHRNCTMTDLPASSAGWKRLIEDAGVFGLLPYLHHVFSQGSIPAPDFARNQASLASGLNMQMLLRRRVRLRPLFTALGDSGMPVVVLKGYALAHLAYPTPESRQMSDVDLLVPAGRLADAREIARRQGFQDTETIAALRRLGSPLQDDYTLLRSADGYVRLDIHDHIPSFTPFAVELPAVLARARAVEANGLNFFVLAPEDFLAHLSLHLAHHHAFTSRLLSCLDLAIFLGSPLAIDLDWEQVLQRAKAGRYLPWLQVALAVSQVVTGISVPDRVFAEVPNDFAAAVSLGVEQVLYRGRSEINSNLMGWLAEPSISGLVKWNREFSQVHQPRSPASEAPTLGSRLLRHLKRLRWFLSREGVNPAGWSSAIRTARSRKQLLELTSAWKA